MAISFVKFIANLIFLKTSDLEWQSFNVAFLDLASLLFFSIILILIFIYDLKYYMIPNKILYLGIIFGLILLILKLFLVQFKDHEVLGFHNKFFHFGSQIGIYFFASFFVFGFFLLLYLVSHKKWIGAGDVKLGLLLGLIIPWPNILVMLFLAFVLGAAISILLVLLKKKEFCDTVPFGVFLVLATFLTIFFGDAILKWYLGLLI